uniref:Zinc finger CCCH domain-containing protein 59 isoform X2 n=1 Tax=Elaeis guineensis var. tenera TaxID=51953 RepID=A0A6J0PNC3_ELAGV|nr:zinc finger CCCH domain-containing protein 59 isoform X2 [Elaeis guineensis]
MATTSTPRILFCGDVLGNLHQLFKRVQTVNKSSGPFDALFCVGQFFPDSADRPDELSDYLDGRVAVPIPTYFTGDYGVGAARFLSAASKLPSNLGFKTDGVQLCSNLYWLKGSGRFSLHGLSVVYLSGRRSQDAGGYGVYTEDDVDALRALAEEPGIVDMFLTEWPSGVSNGADTSNAPPGVSDPSAYDSIVSELVAEIKPRYHIAGTKGVYYAREPYCNKEAEHVTRFIGLAAVGNKEKQKFIHAISPTPASMMSTAEIRTRPPNTTLSPYMLAEKTSHAREATKRPANSDIDTQYWRFDVSKRQKQGGAGGDKLCFKFTSSGSCSRGEKCNYRHDADARDQYLRNVCFDFLNKGKCERGPDCNFNHSLSEEGASFSQNARSHSDRRSSGKNCWFCLSSPNVESHLVISIGESYYCTLAKGALVQNHVLLVPIEHCPNTLMMPSETDMELAKYKNALNMYYKNQANEVVFFEWIFQHSPHANLQAVPIPLSKASNVQRIFNLAAKKLGFEFAVVNPDDDSSEGRKLLRSQFDGKSSIFYVELPEGTILSHLVDDKEKFPVQFGREVLAGLLSVPERADWKNCKLNKDEEVQIVESFKKGFGDYDPAKGFPS